MDPEELFVSPFDPRQYDSYTLPNGLDVLLCSDTTSQSASCAMGVNVGALADGDISGTAHLIEHMLFVSSEKYPEHHAYAAFMTKNSGMSNAYTGSERTMYYFEIPDSAFATAFDMFSQFFITPRFDDDATEKEVSAVHSEHTKNLQKDVWRFQQMNRSLAGDTPYRHFSTGNEETLLKETRAKGIDICDVLRDFHRRYYVPTAFKLVVYSPRSLEEMKAMVGLSYGSISPVLNPESPPQCPSNPWPAPEDCGRIIYVKPVAEKHELRLQWMMPIATTEYEKGVFVYMTHLLGHEGEGGLASIVKKRGWANECVVGAFEKGHNVNLLGVQFDLTEAGMASIEDLAELTFAFIGLARRVGPSETFFKEIAALSRTEFLFEQRQGPSESTQGWAESMLDGLKRRHYLFSSRVMESYEPDAIMRGWEHLTPENVNIVMYSPTIADKCNLRETWYQTEYGIERMSSLMLQRFHGALEGRGEFASLVALPLPNPFVATEFALVPESRPSPPELICEDRFCQVWYRQEHEFRLPHTAVVLLIHSSAAYVSPQCAAQLALFSRLLEDTLFSVIDDAAHASLHASISNTNQGIVLTVSGLSQKLPVLMTAILDTIEYAQERLSFDRFPSLREKLMREYQNYDLTTDAYQRAMHYSSVALESPRWAMEEYLEALEWVNLHSFKSFLDSFLQCVHFSMLIEGNVTRLGAWSIADHARKTLFCSKRKAMPMSAMAVSSVLRRAVRLPLGMSVLNKRVSGENDPNNGLSMRFQIPGDSIRMQALVMLFNSLFSGSFETQLRGKKELGYVVLTYPRREHSILYWTILIQTERRMELAEEFISEWFRGQTGQVSPQDVQQAVSSLISQMRQPDASLSDMVARHWGHVLNRTFDFERGERIASYLEEPANLPTPEDISQFFFDFIAPFGRKRRVLMTHIWAGPRSLPNSEKALEELNGPVPRARNDDVATVVIDSMALWRQSRPLFAGPATSAKL